MFTLIISINRIENVNTKNVTEVDNIFCCSLCLIASELYASSNVMPLETAISRISVIFEQK